MSLFGVLPSSVLKDINRKVVQQHEKALDLHDDNGSGDDSLSDDDNQVFIALLQGKAESPLRYRLNSVPVHVEHSNTWKILLF
jgi:hypothetical protein